MAGRAMAERGWVSAGEARAEEGLHADGGEERRRGEVAGRVAQGRDEFTGERVEAREGWIALSRGAPSTIGKSRNGE